MNLTKVVKMIDVSVTKMSSKGQIVIPQEMREDIKEGEKLIIIKSGRQIIMKKASDMGENVEEDLIFAKRTEEALRRYEKGEFKEMSFDDFIKEAKRW